MSEVETKTELSQIGNDGLGCCVENSQRLILWDAQFKDATYCEGIVWNDRLKVNMRHAWLEMSEVVIDSAKGKANAFFRPEYYLYGQISNVREFNMEEVRTNVVETGMWEFIILTAEDEI